MSVVFLCVGAAKAGTSWLHSQLSAHPECHFRSIKELHYFDALDDGTMGRNIQRIQSRQIGLLERTGGGIKATPAQAAKIADGSDWLDVLEKEAEDSGAYLSYLRKGASDRQIIGEMTPAYALLSAERLAKMARMASDVRFLYLMRDPVERVWSHVRMIAGRRDQDGVVTGRRCDRILRRSIAGDETQIARRSDYAGTLRRLAAAVPGGRLLIEVFEEMVAGPGLARICDFLGIGRISPDPVPVHEGYSLAMTQAQRRAAAHWLAPQYDAAREALGRMPEAWGREV
ncbi:MAG: sulfotransferase [Silicimonas sp.]|nr:sulfotransferase [Silicimonas sp.]